MDHARSCNLHPPAVFADRAPCTFTDQAGNIDLRTGFGKRKKGGPKTDGDVLSIHLLGKLIEGLLQVHKPYILIDVKTFHLVKETMRPGGYRFIAINSSRHDGPDRRPLI